MAAPMLVQVQKVLLAVLVLLARCRMWLDSRVAMIARLGASSVWRSNSCAKRVQKQPIKVQKVARAVSSASQASMALQGRVTKVKLVRANRAQVASIKSMRARRSAWIVRLASTEI
jgi:hypothetical protein